MKPDAQANVAGVPVALDAEAGAEGVRVSVDGHDDARSVRATLDAWRERGVDRIDRTRYRVIDALERRVANYRGTARRVLEQRLASLVAAYERDIEANVHGNPASSLDGPIEDTSVIDPDRHLERVPRVVAVTTAGDSKPRRNESMTGRRSLSSAARGPLSELVDYLSVNGRGERVVANVAGTRAKAVVQQEVEVLDYFREIWWKLNSESQWRQFSTQVPENAGPLNTEKLMVRSLSLMRDLSPEYLRQFLGYVNALSWMQELAGEPLAAKPAVAKPVAVKKETPRAPAARKTSRAKAK